MTSALRFECRTDAAGPWLKLGTLTPQVPPGSISHNAAGARDVILFRCCGDYSLVERSLGGADIEEGAARTILTDGTELLATLRDGESFEMAVTSDGGRSYTARWTHQGDR